MHRGVRELIDWIENHREIEGVRINPPATTADLGALEQGLGQPLPADLRLVLSRFNGGTLPNGQLLPVGIEPGTIGAAVREYAEAVGRDFLDRELLLPFYRTAEGSLLAFDRSAGPVADTWPIVDYYEDTGEERLVYRTFDGFCRCCLADWTSPDFAEEFTLDTYLRQGERHAAIETDVATSHATVAHAYKRAGLPERALGSYLAAARCVPPLPWCDWEALKIAALLDRPEEAFEAAHRLCARAPVERWDARETSPGRVAEAMSRIAARANEKRTWLRLFHRLLDQAFDADERAVIEAHRAAVAEGGPVPLPRPLHDAPIVPPVSDPTAWWTQVEGAYHAGHLRDEDLLLEPSLQALNAHKRLGDALRIRRDF